jgi:flagellar basal body-associated protein FliL
LKSGSRTIWIVIIIIFCFCILAASAINLYLKKKREDRKNETREPENDFSNVGDPGNVFHKEPTGDAVSDPGNNL